MSGDWKPGTVAKATVRGVPDVTVFRRDINDGYCDWAHDGVAVGYSCSNDVEVTDVRPLVVLDLNDAPWGGTVNVPATLRQYPAETAQWIADQIEAQTKPPRIPEPAMYGIITGHIGEGGPWKFVRSEYGWVCLDDGAVWAWETIVAPVLVREGVES